MKTIQATKSGKFLRWVGVILLGLTGFFHLMGGVGTSCVALGAEKYDSMAGIVPYKWAYQLFVLVTIAIAIFTIKYTIEFAKGKDRSYQKALIVLVVGAVVTGLHVYTSRTLRGSSMPNDARLYMNALTLIVFLLFLIPGLKKAMGLGHSIESSGAGGSIGAAFIIMGIGTLTVHLWAGPTHTWNGVNFADVWHAQMNLLGSIFILVGLWFGFTEILRNSSPKISGLPAEVSATNN